MPTSHRIVRARRRREVNRSLPGIARASVWLMALLVTLIGAAGLAAASYYQNLVRVLPPVQRIEASFVSDGQARYQPTVLLDRDRANVLLELSHPAASDRRWLDLDPAGANTLPQRAIQATIAAQDPRFWEHQGYVPGLLAQNVALVFLGQTDRGEGLTITEQLVENTLLATPGGNSIAHSLRRAVLASELTATYSKEELLTWYLNSAYYGRLAFGFDAAALVYFGRHAEDLNLAETAMLAAVPQNPDANPVDDPERARSRQLQALEAMVAGGFITPTEAARARAQRVRLRDEAGEPPLLADDFTRYALGRLEALVGPELLRRGGVRVITTMDYDLQLQAECTLRTHLLRLQGSSPATLSTAQDGSPCVAASFLPPVRPGDVGVDHGVNAGALAVIEPASGELLSLAGIYPLATIRISFETGRPMGSAAYPFIYLTAFARGSTPGTMVLDVPPAVSGGGEPDADELQEGADEIQGPVRMRTALANSYPFAAQQTVGLVGVENVSRTLQQVGLLPLGSFGSDEGDPASGLNPVTLLDLTQGYALLANEGSMAGLAREADDSVGFSALRPAPILRIEDAAGQTLYSYEPIVRSVLSPQLAYLMIDVLSDEGARWQSLGRANPLEIGRPAGAFSGFSPDQRDHWTLGFTPSRTVGVWIGNLEDRALRGVDAYNGASAVWHALQRYATRELPTEAWVAPPGISLIEVCDPSGLLPTEHCPRLVREIFLHGTEPTHFDNLYRPFRINKETGRLATLFTPLDLVEERVYLIPPPEAAPWAALVGIELPPDEYDLLFEPTVEQTGVSIDAPTPFATLRSRVTIRGSADSEGLSYYRLQYGQGLNPTRWVQIGQDSEPSISSGVLGRWDTTGLTGLYILQLVGVFEDGRVATSAIPLTLDNTPPDVQLLLPGAGQSLSRRDSPLVLEAAAADDLSLEVVEFFLDGEKIGEAVRPPYSVVWAPSELGEHEAWARAYDTAGNRSDSDAVTFRVVR